MTTCPGTARPPRGGLVPTNAPVRLSLSTRTVALWKPAAASAARQSSTESQPGTGLVLPRTTAGSAGGKSAAPPGVEDRRHRVVPDRGALAATEAADVLARPWG